MTQKQLANESGLHPAVISFYETGSRKPGLDNLAILSKVLRVSIDDLVFGPAKVAINLNQSFPE